MRSRTGQSRMGRPIDNGDHSRAGYGAAELPVRQHHSAVAKLRFALGSSSGPAWSEPRLIESAMPSSRHQTQTAAFLPTRPGHPCAAAAK